MGAAEWAAGTRNEAHRFQPRSSSDIFLEIYKCTYRCRTVGMVRKDLRML